MTESLEETLARLNKPPDKSPSSDSTLPPTPGIEAPGISDNVKPSPITPTPTGVASEFIVKEPEEKKPLTGIDYRIEESRGFNEKLTGKKVVEETIVESVKPTASKESRIAEVLRSKGMDSQQQAQAMEMIRVILAD